jgi:hypothetical protein
LVQYVAGALCTLYMYLHIYYRVWSVKDNI